jgi:DNA-directed RNA polymerase alpha subunit
MALPDTVESIFKEIQNLDIQIKSLEREKLKTVQKFIRFKDRIDAALRENRPLEFSDLCFTKRTSNGLAAAKIRTIKRLTSKSRAELLKLPNLGKGSVTEIEDSLAMYDLHLKGGYLRIIYLLK